MTRALLLLVLFAVSAPLSAAPREAQWKQVEQIFAAHADASAEPVDPFTAKPPTEAELQAAEDDSNKIDQLLKDIQTAAFADGAWAEGAKALALRLDRLDFRETELPTIIKHLDGEILAAPAEAKPILRCLLAHYYYI